LKPLVGVGILNYNGASLTIKCLDHLQKLDWPADRLAIVVVDNASTDDSVMRIKLTCPEVNLISSPTNRGFAGGCNLAIKSMTDVDYVALLNNDAMVEPGWLEPLVETLEARPEIGAACSKILFATRFMDLTLESDTFRPVGLDTRNLGVRVSGMRIGSEDRMNLCHFPSGFYQPERGGGKEPGFRWTDGKGVLRLPFDPDDQHAVCRLRVSAETTKPLKVQVGDRRSNFEVTNMPQWIEVSLSGEPFDMINNVGSDLVDSKNAADRGIFQRDLGQFDEPDEVFAWCGCSVLLSKRYLDDVGLFDEGFFLYYEDFDLSWRGQRRGWKYAYVPSSVVRHFHASTTGEYSDLFNFYVWRNRLLVLVKNASAAIAGREAASFGSHVIKHLRADLRSRTLSNSSRTLLRTSASFLVHAPIVFMDRLRIGLRNRRSPLKDRTVPS
jgi:GT2 family glycosyltransferase